MQATRNAGRSTFTRHQFGQLALAGILFLAGHARATIAAGLTNPAAVRSGEAGSFDFSDSHVIVPINTAGDRGEAPLMNV